jgi:hypothetical protein
MLTFRVEEPMKMCVTNYQIKCCFVIRIYSVTGRRYVMKKVDELTKNRRDMDRENISGTYIYTPSVFRIYADIQG